MPYSPHQAENTAAAQQVNAQISALPETFHAPRSADVRARTYHTYVSTVSTVSTDFEEIGFLVVSISTANGAVPLENALVTVFTILEDGVRQVMHTVYTDKSGKTPKLSLPAPPQSHSLAAGTKDAYARYTVLAELEGYHPDECADISIFPCIVTNFPIVLMPKSQMLTDPAPPPKRIIPEHRLYANE